MLPVCPAVAKAQPESLVGGMCWLCLGPLWKEDMGCGGCQALCWVLHGTHTLTHTHSLQAALTPVWVLRQGHVTDKAMFTLKPKSVQLQGQPLYNISLT